MRADDGSFLADDTQLAPYEVGGGWVLLGEASVGERSFVGNSGIVSPGPQRARPLARRRALQRPAHARTSGRRGWVVRRCELPRVAEPGDPARTFDPPRRLVAARAFVESMRVIPWVVMACSESVCSPRSSSSGRMGLGCGRGHAGLVMFGAGLVAALVTTLAKWLLVGRFTEGQHPLWSSFVWRNELFDVFYEELGVPWFGGPFLGTPIFNAWARRWA